MTKGGALKSVLPIGDSDLEVNGGRYTLQQGPAIKVRGFRSDNIGSRKVKGGDDLPVYVLRDTDIESGGGRWKVNAGQAIQVSDVIGNARGIIQGTAIPIFPVDDNGNYDTTWPGYIWKVLTPNQAVGYDPSGLIGFWTQDEAAGGISYDHSGYGHNGAYTGVTLGQPGVPGMGMTSPLYEGNDYNDIFSAALAAVFDGTKGTVFEWIRVANAGVWTDGALHSAIHIGVDGGTNYIRILKAADNLLQPSYTAGGVGIAFNLTITTTDWFSVAITWSAIDDEFFLYLDGIIQFGPVGGLGVWAGALLNGNCQIGAQTTGPLFPWHGYLGPTLLYTEALTPAQISYLNTI